ncbi:nicotinate-nucleotide adenylyltransferase [Thiocapsa marina]|uniref:Probable nicotinate-nucleotide adenylyltransferase n=1 Tax=Thiocapsa marina 5811 TaxID=768671 RepID=F9U9I1_9GAMM|nr:nicotinate-nucleotide adenylyltransferase [Thiocapsa marina]EGV19439.1 nicotinate-nucleotide adenylyltransferase [Thiocapsa marina 5811]
MIGVLGGTFDPIHSGHLRPALDCFQALGLEEIRLVPLNVAVHRAPPVASSAQRLAMLEAAIAGQPGFVADPRELERPGGSYTYDTLISLRAELGGERPLCLLIGADAFAGFLGWHRPADILGLAHLVVMRRPGASEALDPALESFCSGRLRGRAGDLAETPAGRILFQSVTQIDVSATRVRELIRRGLSPRWLLPDAVISIIAAEGLYR